MPKQKVFQNIPYFLLFTLSFFPVMKANIASMIAICYLTTTLVFYWNNFKTRFNELGLKPLIANCGFYILLVISIGYSDDYFIAFKTLQASILLLFFPIITLYFLPRIEKKTIEYFSYGFIISVFVLLLYFFNLLVDALEVDRIYKLSEKGFIEQLKALNTYPYEFVLSKAFKHLEVLFESHKVYLSLQFLVAIVLSVNLIVKHKVNNLKKVVLLFLILIFTIAIIYTQAITTVLTLFLLVIMFPFFYFKGSLKKVAYLSLLIIFGFFSLNSGFFKTYSNKNTTSVIKLLRSISENDLEEGTDKRIYIYSCSIHLIKNNVIFGYGVGDVQNELNNCYQENDYVVAEYESVGSNINSHNYYLNLWLAGGIITLLFFLFMLVTNLQIAIKSNSFCYGFFLLIFTIGLLTENILVRMSGVFLFVILNSLFHSINHINDEREN